MMERWEGDGEIGGGEGGRDGRVMERWEGVRERWESDGEMGG